MHPISRFYNAALPIVSVTFPVAGACYVVWDQATAGRAARAYIYSPVAQDIAYPHEAVLHDAQLKCKPVLTEIPQHNRGTACQQCCSSLCWLQQDNHAMGNTTMLVVCVNQPTGHQLWRQSLCVLGASALYALYIALCTI